MVGALLLAARAALRLGAGRVWCAPLDPRLAIDPMQPELMFAIPEAVFDLPPPGCLVIGPGLGRTQTAREILQAALGSELSLLIDADALNLLAEDASMRAALRKRIAATVYTPHPGEAARMLGQTRLDSEREAVLAALGERYPGVIVLKGAGTLIQGADGACWRNPSGNPGLAAPGMGDTLAGIIAALIAQGLNAERAACLGVWLHGAAGDALRQEIGGMVGITAGEVAIRARQILNRHCGAAD